MKVLTSIRPAAAYISTSPAARGTAKSQKLSLLYRKKYQKSAISQQIRTLSKIESDHSDSESARLSSKRDCR